MARQFTSSNSQYLSKSVALVTAYPVVLAVWVYITALPPSSGNVYYYPIAVSDPASTIGLNIFIDYNNEIYASNDYAATVAGPAIPILNAWMHLAAVFTSSAAMKLYLNGTPTGAAVSAGAFPVGLSASYIGYYYNSLNSPFSFYMNGRIAFPAIWQGWAAKDADIAGLAKGISPLRNRPQGLVAYPRLSDGVLPTIEPDLVSATGWTPTASKPTLIANPPIYGP